MRANAPIDPKTKIKNQFILNKGESEVPQHKYQGIASFETSNTFFNGMTAVSSTKLKEQEQTDNPVLKELDPSVFEVAAKKNAAVWKTEQYKDKDFRAQLTNTTNRGIHSYDPEIAQMLVTNKHNIQVTNISEYSNALNRGRVFINPKFSSC